MSVLHITGLKKLLGSQEILRGVDLRIERGERVGCVGRNGEGKTTLLRLIEGEETPDGGVVQLTRGARIGYVTQRPAFDPGVTVRAYVEAGLDEVHRLERELEEVSHALADPDEARQARLVVRHGELTARMDFLGGWESERRVDTVLDGIGLVRALWEREARTLSGGEKSRTAMARELVSVPDLLLLDEPTNHLDLAGIEWLEDYLKSIASAVLMVSHDRRLLDQLVETIVEVERGKLNRYVGNYSRYVEVREERFRTELRAWEQQQDTIRREEVFIKKHMGSQRTGEAKGRRKRLQSLERLPQPHNDVRRPVIRMKAVERGGEQVFEARGLALGYGDNRVLDGADVRLGRGERVGIIGPNGSGKSTLLKALAGRLTPLAGETTRGYRATCGYFDQETAELRDDGTPYTEIRRDHPKLDDLEIRSHLARFLFRGKEVDLSVGSLSGGERARLSLARLVLTEPSWLALDEPTNHLDLPGRTAMEEMLGEFPGAMLFISHDREFLDRLASRIIEVKDGRVRSQDGNYTAYKASVEARASAERPEKTGKAQRPSQGAQARASGSKARRSGSRSKSKRSGSSSKGPGAKVEGAVGPSGSEAQSKGSKPKNPWRFKRLEEAIMSLEEQRQKMLEALGREEVYKDPNALRDTQVRLAEVERNLEEKNLEWERWI